MTPPRRTMIVVPGPLFPESRSAGLLGRIAAVFLATLAVSTASLGPCLADASTEVVVNVVDEAGAPVVGVEVALTATDSQEKSLGQKPFTRPTGKKGSATFPFLPYNGQGEGRYEVSINKSGWFVREFSLESRQVQSSADLGSGTIIQDPKEYKGKLAPGRKVPALLAKPSGHAIVNLTIAPIPEGGAATSPDTAPAGGAPASGGAPAVQAGPVDPLDAARSLESQGKYAEAETALKSLAESKPSADVDYEFARLYHLQKLTDQEKSALTRTLAKDPNYPNAHFSLARIAYDSGRTDDAIGHLEAEIKAHPDNKDALKSLASMYAGAGRSADAIRSYEAVLAADPESSEALVALDGLYTAQGDHAKSEQTYKKVLALNPTGADQVYFRVGSAIMKSDDLTEGDRRRALAAFKKAVELNPKNAKAHRELGYVLVGLGNLEEAKTQFKAYLELLPSAPDAASIKPFLSGN